MDPGGIEHEGAAPAPARRSHVRRYIYGGLAAASAVAIGLVVIFMLGGHSGADKWNFQNAGSSSQPMPMPAATVSIMSEGAGAEAPVLFHQDQSNGYTITTTVKIESLGDAPVDGTSVPSTTGAETSITTAAQPEEPAAPVTTQQQLNDATQAVTTVADQVGQAIDGAQLPAMDAPAADTSADQVEAAAETLTFAAASDGTATLDLTHATVVAQTIDGAELPAMDAIADATAAVTDAITPMPEAAWDGTVVTVEEIAPEIPVDTVMPEEAVHEVHEAVQTIASGESDTAVVDTIQAGTKTVNKDTPIGTSDDVAEVVKELADAAKAMNAATSQVNKAIDDAVAIIEELEATSTADTEDPAEVVNTVADTTSNLAQTGANTAATGSLGSGALAQQFAGSNNAGVATAAQVTNQILQSGTIDPKAVHQMAGGANPQAAAGLSACQASINGNEAAIQQHYTALGTSMVNSDTISGAAALGQSLIKTWAATSGEAVDPLYQLFRIYLDQQGNAGKALTTTQQKAYDQLSPQCNAAFDDIVKTYEDSKGSVSSLQAGGNKNVMCSNYKNADTAVDVTLCVWIPAVWTKEKIMANITATFTNYGVQLCDVSFYVINLEKALVKSPVWLPNANTAFPNGIEKGREIAIEASVPWSQDIAANAPLVDILKGWSACPNGKATPVTPVTPATPAKPSSGAESTFTQDNANNFASALKESSTKFGDPLQAAALLKDSQIQLKQYVGTAACWPQDADELTSAIHDDDCSLVVLTNCDPDAYTLSDPIQVTRSVRVMGNPAVLPTIDGSGTERCFTVGPGGFLELSFVRTKQGGGTTRDRYGLEGLDLPSQVVEIRGGAVAVEPGALGANFVGVVFTGIANTPASVQNAITSTLNFVGTRVYGGHVFVAVGNVNFFGCHFWDTTLLLPLTDQVTIGGDVLVIGGNVFLTGCTFTVTRLFGSFSGLGFNVGVLGGNMVMTFCVIQAQGVAESANGAGQVLFVGGGTMILMGVDFRFASACFLFTGIGDFFVGGGVMVFTGVTVENAYPILAAYGAGFYLAVGGGVMVETGVTYVQYNAPAHQALTGASIFVGAGTSLHTGVPASFYGTTVLFTGQGGWAYNGAGYSMWLGCPIAIFAATLAFFGLGGLTSQTAGFMVYIGNPAFTPAAISYFVGAGVVMFLGAGGAVVGGSPVYAPAYIFRAAATPGGAGANYYVAGNQDYANGIGYMEKDGRVGYFYDRPSKEEKNITKARQLTDKEAFDGAIRELKAERKLSVSSVSNLLTNFAPDAMFGPTRFIGADLQYKPSMDLNKIAQEGWVPEPILSAAREIEMLKNKFLARAGISRGLLADSVVTVTAEAEEALETFGQEDRPMLGMDSEDVEYCGVCGEGATVGGAAADQCMEFESCDAFRAVAPQGTEAAFDWNELSFDPWYIVQGEMNPASDKAINADLFRDGLRSFFVTNETSGVQVTAYSLVPDELFANIMPDLPVSKALAEDFGVSNPMSVVFLVNDKAKADAIKEAISNPGSEEHDNMLFYLQDYLAVDDIKVAGLDSTWKKDIYIPAYNSPAFAKAFADEVTRAAGTNSVRLVQAGKEGLPLSHAVPGETYTIEMANFKPATDLTVQLIGSQDVGGVAKQMAEVLGKATTDKNGVATIQWVFPADAPAGTYYLRAVDSTGAIFGMSPALDVVGKARRKLYGPLVEL